MAIVLVVWVGRSKEVELDVICFIRQDLLLKCKPCAGGDQIAVIVQRWESDQLSTCILLGQIACNVSALSSDLPCWQCVRQAHTVPTNKVGSLVNDGPDIWWRLDHSDCLGLCVDRLDLSEIWRRQDRPCLSHSNNLAVGHAEVLHLGLCLGHSPIFQGHDWHCYQRRPRSPSEKLLAHPTSPSISGQTHNKIRSH